MCVAYEYVLPAGLVRSGQDDPLLEEGYRVQWRDEDHPPHYFFWVQASALRIERLFADAILLFPPRVHAVLEVRRTDDELEQDPDGPAQDRWASGPVTRERFLKVWATHAAALVHDGTVGFGAYDPDSPLEAFIDDHKLLTLFSAGLEPFESLMRRYGLPEAATFPTVLDSDHEHLTLHEVRSRDADARRAWGRRKGLDVAHFVPAICKSLRMHLQESTADEGSDT